MKRQFPPSLHHSCIKTCIRGIYVYVTCTTKECLFYQICTFFFKSIKEIDTEERHQIISSYKKWKSSRVFSIYVDLQRMEPDSVHVLPQAKSYCIYAHINATSGYRFMEKCWRACTNVEQVWLFSYIY